MNKLRLSRIEGNQIDLRLVQLDDAAFIHGLRTDQSLNEHLSEVTGPVEDQCCWTTNYKECELSRCEYYFIIERKNGIRCGAVRLYNIKGDRFTWVSWILNHNKPRKAALESALFSFYFGFETIELAVANVEVQVNNTRAIEFYRRFGMIEINLTEQEIFFLLTRMQFDANKGAFSFILENENTNV